MPPIAAGAGRVARSRYQSIDDTIVQLFISQASVLMTRIDRIQSKSPQPESSGASVATAKIISWLQLHVTKSISERSTSYERICLLLGCSCSAMVCVVYMAQASGRSDGEADPVFGITIPPGYRDWKLISVAHEEGNLNDLRALLGNDVAIKAYRERKLPFPDGTIIARLAWSYVPSEENNKVFGRSQSFVAGPATNVQFMVKDSKKYAATGGWGFAQFKDGKPADAALLKTCFPCHEPVKARDFVFTHYAP